jgi:LEA14-like dessication related protein
VIRKVRYCDLLLTLLFVLLLNGCATLRPEPPEVQLAGLTVSELSLTHANFLATVNLYNPNSAALEVERLQFELFLDEIRVARGVTTKQLTIPAEQSGSAALRLSTSFLDLFRLAQKLKGLDHVPFRLAGEVKVGGPGFLWMTVPIASQGDIPLTGSFEQLLSSPDEFWRQPDRLVPEGNARPDAAKPLGR